MNPKRSSIVIALLLMVSLTACSTEPSTATVQTTSNNVTFTTIKQQALDVNYDLSGTLTAYNETPVTFRTAGTVTAVKGEIGQQVNKGAVLATLDTADLQLSLADANQSVAAAQADLSSANASLKDAQAAKQNSLATVSSANAQLESAQAKIESARVSQQSVLSGARSQEKAQAQNAVNKAQTAYNQAKAEATRSQTLASNGLLTQQENEQAQTALADATDSLKDAQAKLSLIVEGASASERASAASTVKEAQTGIANAQATIEQAKAGVAQAEAGIAQSQANIQKSQASYDQAVIAKNKIVLSLSYTTLKAQASGVILEKNVSVGQTVSAGSSGGGAMGGSSDPFVIGETTRLKVLLPIADSEINQWKVGQQVSVSLYDDVRTGKVTKLYPQTNESTGSINAEVTVSNPKQDWKPGQVIKASRQATTQKGILLPVEAVISTGDKPYVFRNNKGKAVQTFVTIGESYNNQYLIKSGLQVGDQVVVQGADRLFNGDALATPANSSTAKTNQSTTKNQHEVTAHD
ncbi:efflux RND transporter periplasmic adaptor subunit [Paenibacillus kyungheensis]